jgi:hypothetical protein
MSREAAAQDRIALSASSTTRCCLPASREGPRIPRSRARPYCPAAEVILRRQLRPILRPGMRNKPSLAIPRMASPEAVMDGRAGGRTADLPLPRRLFRFLREQAA